MITQRHGNDTKSCKTIPSCTRCSKQKRGPSELLSSLKQLRHFAGAPHQHPQHVLKFFRKETEFAWGKVGYRRLCDGILDTECEDQSQTGKVELWRRSICLWRLKAKNCNLFLHMFSPSGTRAHAAMLWRKIVASMLLAKCSKPLCWKVCMDHLFAFEDGIGCIPSNGSLPALTFLILLLSPSCQIGRSSAWQVFSSLSFDKRSEFPLVRLPNVS